MPANFFRPFTAALAGASLLTASLMPVAGHADSWEDSFTAEELDILFGESGSIPSMIGPHRVVMSLDEAKQVEGENPAIVIPIVIGAIGGGIGGGMTAADQGGSIGYGIAIGAISGGVGGAFIPVGSGAWGAAAGGIAGATAGTATGLALGGSNGACYGCHQKK